MRKLKCSFCGKLMKSGTGKMYVKNDGTIFYFCSRKCERNQAMGRDPKKRKWSRKK
ncbi:MAG: 50S ribosomal protein L24e [Candidatus Aenigmatarchaeota archaeon]